MPSLLEMVSSGPPLPPGWLKANNDAAFKGGRAALGVMVRDHRGCVNLIFAKLFPCNSALEAEILALD